MQNNDTLTELFGEPISVYTRAQAIEDGMLIDLTEWASATKGFHGGFNCSVAVTPALWSAIESIPKSAQGLQDVRGRAHDVLWMASLAARRAGTGSRLFKVILPYRGTRKRNQVLRMVAGPGDNAELVITIGLHDDDLS